MIQAIAKILVTISGCENLEQLESAHRLIENFMLTFIPKDCRIMEGLNEAYKTKRSKLN